jgi:hypothetical protein
MASSIQGTIPDQTWGQNLPGYFKDNVKPFVHGTSFLIPHTNPTVPDIVNKSTVGMVNDRGYIDSPALRKDTIRAYIENPSSYVARLHPHDMNSGMGGVENLSNLYSFGHPTPVVNGEDYNDTLYWAKGETSRQRNDPLSAGYAQKVLGPDGNALIQQMKEDQARQYQKEKYRQGVAQASFESRGVTAQQRETEYNNELRAWQARRQAFVDDGNDEDDYEEPPPQPFEDNNMEGEGFEGEADGAFGPVRGGRTAVAGPDGALSASSRYLSESSLMNYVNGRLVQPASVMYSNSLVPANAGRYRQVARTVEPGVRAQFATGGTSLGGGAMQQRQAENDAQLRGFNRGGVALYRDSAEVRSQSRATGIDARGVTNNQMHDGSVLDPTEQRQLGIANLRPTNFATPARAFNPPQAPQTATALDMASAFDESYESLATNVRRSTRDTAGVAPSRFTPGIRRRQTYDESKDD